MGGGLMEINNALEQNIGSIRQAIGISVLRKSMNQDTQTMAALLQGMQSANGKIMENTVTPYKGGNIDIRI
jgi:hypothetical protein